METLTGKTIGDRINSTNGRYYHIIEAIGEEVDRGFGEKAVFVSTRVYSSRGAKPRLVGTGEIMFKKSGGQYITEHVS